MTTATPATRPASSPAGAGPSAAIVEADGLSKAYSRRWAVRDLSLTIRQGEMVGFLGPNGAGKTTTILMLLGLVRPTRGRATLFGQAPAGRGFTLRRRVGVTTEQPRLPDDQSGWDYLRFFAALYGVAKADDRIAALLCATDLYEHRHRLLGTYSRGMQVKIGVVRALLHRPALLILDEPTAGLDPESIRQVRELIVEATSDGATVLVSSHILSEIERTCQRVGIMSEGRLLIDAPLVEIKSRGPSAVQVDVAATTPALLDCLAGTSGVSAVRAQGPQTLYLNYDGRTDTRARIARAIVAAGGELLRLCPVEPTLEDAYIAITRAARMQPEGVSET